MKKELILVRHAHRSKKLGREVDNGLSAKGKKQARKFKKAFQHLPAKECFFLSSPKKRCIETLKPLALKKRRRIHILKSLDEGAPLTAKITRFLKELKKIRKKYVFVCSHGDWIPVFLKRVLDKRKELKKGDWIVLDY